MPDKLEFQTSSQEETKEIAREFMEKHLKNAENSSVICLYGELGAGKTVFTKGLAQALGIPEKKIKSPTFTFIRAYQTAFGKVYHCDFYRLETVDEFLKNTVLDLLDEENTLLIIEWAEKIQDFLPQKRTEIHIDHTGEEQRTITIQAYE